MDFLFGGEDGWTYDALAVKVWTTYNHTAVCRIYFLNFFFPMCSENEWHQTDKKCCMNWECVFWSSQWSEKRWIWITSVFIRFWPTKYGWEKAKRTFCRNKRTRGTFSFSASLFLWLSPCDFFLFPKLKIHLKGRYLGTLENIKMAITDKLKVISVSEFQYCHEE